MRLLDVGGAACLLVTLSPVALVAAILVAVTDVGPVLYRQKRVGEGGALFEVLKFRTMRSGAHDEVLADSELRRLYAANDFKLPGDDQRITRVGAWLRRTSIDEIPQLVNVLRGEMALVGVRPMERAQLESRSTYDQQLYCSFRPGLTGLWQVSGRSTTSRADRIRLDRECLESMSIRNYLRYLLRTPSAVFTGIGAH